MTSRPSIWHDLKQLLTLAWPVVVSRIGFMTMGLIDTVVVGRYSTMQLGFHALAWAVSGVVLTTGIGLVSGRRHSIWARVGWGPPEGCSDAAWSMAFGSA